MFKDVLTHSNLTHWAEAGLVIFFLTFLAISIWALTRRSDEIRRWSEVPINDEPHATPAPVDAEEHLS